MNSEGASIVQPAAFTSIINNNGVVKQESTFKGQNQQIWHFWLKNYFNGLLIYRLLDLHFCVCLLFLFLVSWKMLLVTSVRNVFDVGVRVCTQPGGYSRLVEVLLLHNLHLPPAQWQGRRGQLPTPISSSTAYRGISPLPFLLLLFSFPLLGFLFPIFFLFFLYILSFPSLLSFLQSILLSPDLNLLSSKHQIRSTSLTPSFHPVDVTSTRSI